MNTAQISEEALADRLPRSWRPAWLPDWVKLRREDELVAHGVEARTELFLSYLHAREDGKYDVEATEIEVLNWLHANVCLLKPERILETGAAHGLGTIALAAACRANGFGKVHTVEIDPDSCEATWQNLRQAGLTEFAEVHCQDSISFVRSTTSKFEFAWFDSHIPLRCLEFNILRKRDLIAGMSAFHDTSPYRPFRSRGKTFLDLYRKCLYKAAEGEDVLAHYEVALSRGVFVILLDNASFRRRI